MFVPASGGLPANCKCTEWESGTFGSDTLVDCRQIMISTKWESGTFGSPHSNSHRDRRISSSRCSNLHSDSSGCIQHSLLSSYLCGFAGFSLVQERGPHVYEPLRKAP